MKSWISSVVVICLASAASADRVSLTSGRDVDGTIIQETPERVTVLLEYGTITLPRSVITAVRKSPAAPRPATSENAEGRIPAASVVLPRLGRQAWATGLRQVP